MAYERGAFLLTCLAFAVIVAAGDLGYAPTDLQSQDGLRARFHAWRAKFRKTYHHVAEEAHRFEVFHENLKYIHETNEQGKSYKLGLNEYADMTHDEFKTKFLGRRFDPSSWPLKASTGFSHSNVLAPEAVDWRKEGAVTKVKNQLQCGSCWAFSTTGSVEGINKIVTGTLSSLSEQELVDCDRTQDQGCQGGLMDYAFDFIVANGGIDTEEDYPYKGVNEQCEVDKENSHVVTIDGHEDVPVNDEASLKKAVSQQPVSAAIEADERQFQFYSEGIFDDECGTQLDHGVLAVGYGVENGTGYWIVKNSWGPTWGDNGYIRLKMGVRPEGQCGIAMVASYPLKSGPNPPPSPPSPHPQPPAPSPEQCDPTHTCETGTTCCCGVPLGKFCLAWGCCPMEKATCCSDHRHCCPHDYPVCELDAGICSKGPGSNLWVPMKKKLPAKFHFSFPTLRRAIAGEKGVAAV